LFSGFDAVEVRHSDVDYGHIGLQLVNQPNRFLAVSGLPNDLKVLLTLQAFAGPFSNKRVVVSNKDADLVHVILFLRRLPRPPPPPRRPIPRPFPC